MAYPNLYGVTYSYTGFQQAQGDNSFPGTQLDADLAGLQSSISGLAAFVEQGFRSDGALANGSVGYDQLSPSLQLAGISAASAWLTGTAYAVGAGVVQTQKLYRCAIAHTSGVFATDLAGGKWVFVANIGINNSGVSVAGRVPVYADTSGVLLADSGVALSALAPLVSPVFTTPNIGVATGTSLTLSGALTAGSFSFGTLAVAGVVTITPTANTLTQGLSVTQTLPTGTAALNTAYSANLISIVNNGYQTPAGGASDSFGLFPVVAGFRVNYSTAGNGIGTYPIHIGGLFATKATSVGQQLVGLNGTVYSNIDSSGNDSFWSAIGYANIGPLANINGVYGFDAEVAVSAGASVNYRIGVASSSLAPTQGSIIDAAFAVTAAVDKEATTAPWHNALVLWKTGTYAPIDQAVITASGTFTAQYCIKLDTVTFANKIFDFGSTIFQMDGAGNTTFGGTVTANLSISLIKTANSPAVFSINNLSTGAAATASMSITNNLDQAAFGLAGSNYTTVSQLANRAYVHSGPANNGIILDAAGAKPIDFYVNNARAGGFTSAGALTLTTPLAAASGGTGLSALGTGVATALGINVGSAGAPVLFNGAGGTPSSLTLTNATGLPTTGLTGTLQAAQEPAHTGDMTNTAGSLATLVTKTNGVAFTAYATAAIGQLPGTTTNDSASAGNVGEIITSTLLRASATAITTATPKTVTSISLTAGDWEVDVVGGFVPANTTSVTQLVVSMSTTTNTLDTTEGKLGVLTVPGTTFDGATQAQVSLPPFRFSLSATTTVYLVAQSNFTVSTNAAFGIIKARRVR